MYREKEFQSWSKLREFLDKRVTHHIFRGQSCYEWGLCSAIDRFNKTSNISNEDLEKAINLELHRNIYNIPNELSKSFSDDFQLISFLQHYGAPTRLLDFTSSPYVALFFALENAKTESSIFAINSLWISDKASEYINNLISQQNEGKTSKHPYVDRSLSDRDVFKRIFLSNTYSFVGTVEPYFKFDRILSQQSVFLCQGNINQSFEENLQSMIKEVSFDIYKIKVPINLREEILKSLKKMNITRASLFPGTEGFVQSLALNQMLEY